MLVSTVSARMASIKSAFVKQTGSGTTCHKHDDLKSTIPAATACCSCIFSHVHSGTHNKPTPTYSFIIRHLGVIIIHWIAAPGNAGCLIIFWCRGRGKCGGEHTLYIMVTPSMVETNGVNTAAGFLKT